MRTNCHSFLFPSAKEYHFIFKKPELPPNEPTGASEKPKTLFETLQEARKMVEKAKEKIKLVEDYYKGKILPKDLKKALDNFKKITKELEQAVLNRSKAQGEWEGKAGEKKQVKTEQEIIEEMMNSMDEIFGDVRETNEDEKKKSAGDPLNSHLDELEFKETTLRPLPPPKMKGVPLWDDEVSAPKKKSDAKAKVSYDEKEKPQPVTKKVVAKGSPEYWDMQIHSVIQKMLQKMETGVDPGELLPEEKQVVMFIADPGKSRSYDYRDGTKVTRVTLERDTTGQYLRIRGYKTGTPAQAEVKNPSIMAFPTKNKAKWLNEAPQYTPEEKIENNKNDLGKKLEWLSSPKVPYGSRIGIGQTISSKDLEDGSKLVKKFWITIIKESGGAYRVETYVQDIEKNKKGSGKPLVQGGPKQDEMVRTFGTPGDTKDYVEGFIKDDASIVAMEASDFEKANEEKLAEEKRLQKLEQLSGNLMRYAVLGHGHDGNKSEWYLKSMQAICDFVSRNNVKEWDSKNDFMIFHVRVRDGYVSLLEKNEPFSGKKPSVQYKVVDRTPVSGANENENIA